MTATEAELGWLAGMLEGEGCITFFQQARKRGGYDIITGIQITNTDVNIISKLNEILKKCDLSWFLRDKKVYSKNHTQCFYLECRQQAMLRKSLEILIPYMYGNKKSKANLVLDYLNKRNEASKTTGKYRTRYTEDDFSMIPRDYTSSVLRGDEIVHTE